MGEVRDQGSFGSCVGFASAGVKDNQESREYGGNVVTSPLFIYRKCKEMDDIPTVEGTYPRVAMKVLANLGVCLEKQFPYSLMSWPRMPVVPDIAMDSAINYKIGAYVSIGTVEEVKQSIVNDGPVLGALLVCDNFINAGSNGIIDLPEGTLQGGHAICVVGYDNSMVANGHTGFFEVRNSWGSSWGEGGYCYIPYDFFNGRMIDTGMPFWFESWSSVDIVLPPKACKEGYLWIGKNYALVDGIEVPLDVAPEIKGSRTLVPLRFMTEHMGYKVDWNETKREVHFYK